MNYEEEGRKAGYVVGARVKVLRKCGRGELGWGDRWVSAMDKFINKEFTIKSYDNDGILLSLDGEAYYFPWHVCKHIAPPVIDPKTLNPGTWGHTWDEDDLPENYIVRRFITYVPGAEYPYYCDSREDDEPVSIVLTGYKHFEPLEE